MIPPSSAPRGGRADQPLQADFDAAEVRARFDDLTENMPERYDQQIWDDQVVAYYVAKEAEAAGRAAMLQEIVAWLRVERVKISPDAMSNDAEYFVKVLERKFGTPEPHDE